ncbi:MAG: DUF1330 domain-containing protein [Cytophagales bacterium]|nr:DUF1330 domain-containing protein [Cytophagales bacterium]
MLYYTQLIFLREGQQAAFHDFEDRVLPLLGRHNGQLLYRVRPDRGSVIETAVEYPYEIHLVSFPTRADFEAYRDDPERTQYVTLKDRSVGKVLLIEGRLL